MRRYLLAIYLLVLFVPAIASAQEGDLAEAKRLDAEAKKAFAAEDYELAAEKFHEAHEAYPAASLWKTEVAAWKLAGDCDAVRRAMEHALPVEELPPDHRRDLRLIQVDCAVVLGDEALDDGDVERAREELTLAENLDTDEERTDDVEALRERITAAERRESENDPPEVAETSERDQKKADEIEPRVTVEEPDGPRADGGATALRIAGWSLIGAGAALLVPQAILAANYREPKREYDAAIACENDGGCSEAEVDRAAELRESLPSMVRANRTMWIATGVLAAAGVGILLYVNAKSESRASAIRLSPSGVTYTHRF